MKNSKPLYKSCYTLSLKPTVSKHFIPSLCSFQISSLTYQIPYGIFGFYSVKSASCFTASDKLHYRNYVPSCNRFQAFRPVTNISGETKYSAALRARFPSDMLHYTVRYTGCQVVLEAVFIYRFLSLSFIAAYTYLRIYCAGRM